MKKYIIYFLVLIIALNLMPAAVYAQDKSDYDKSISELISFGIITGELSDIDQNETLTREKAALWIYRAMGIKKEFTESLFSDVPVGSQYANAVLALAENKLISGYPDGKFYPGEPISYTDYITVLINMLEYGRAAKIYGGYPDGYIKAANNLKLNRGVSGIFAQNLNVGESARILCNALETMMLDTQKLLIESLMEIHMTEGRVEKDSKTALAVPEGAGAGKLVIDTTDYIAKDFETEQYLGKKVKAFYTEKDEIRTLVHLEAYDKFDEITVTADEIVREKSDRTLLVYEMDKREHKLKISPVVDIIYNGKAYPDAGVDEIYPDCGEIRLLDSDNDGVYDVIFVLAYDIIYVSNVILGNKTVYNKFTAEGFTKKVSFDDDIEAEFYDVYGEEIEFSDISSGNILHVAISKTGSTPYCRGVVSDNVKRGTVEEVDEEYVMVEQTQYERSKFMTRSLEAGVLSPIEFGAVYYFYLDIYGQIAAYEKVVNGNQYGYLKRAYTDLEAEKNYLKIFTQNNTWETYEMRDNVRYGADNYSAEALVDIIPVGVMVRYKTDGNRRIKEIDTSTLTSLTDEDRITKIKTDTFRKAQASDLKYYSMNKSFESKFFAEADVKVFLIPTARNALDEDFKCTDMNYFISESRYTVDVYDMDEYMFSSIMAIEYDSASSSTLTASLGHDDYCMMVNKVRQIYVDDEVASYVSGIVKGQEWSYTASGADTFAGLRRGDIIRTKYDDSGKLNHYILVHSRGSETLTSNATDINNTVYIYGKVLAVDYEKNRIRIDQGSELTITTANSPYITVYDSYSNEVATGTLQDIRPNDYAVFRMRTSVPFEIFVIR